mgnify:FL=1
MKKLHFESASEFERLFQNQNREVTDAIVNGIERAMEANVKTADLFTITFDKSEHMYDISLPQKHWVVSLESALEFYTDNKCTDEAIDCWKLLECAKVW